MRGRPWRGWGRSWPRPAGRGAGWRARVLRALGVVLLGVASSALPLPWLQGGTAQAGTALWADAEGRARVFDAVVDVFRDHYWAADHVDWDAWAARYHDRVVAASTRQAFDGALRSMVEALDDGHSSWLGLASFAGEEVAPDGPEPSLGLRTRYLDGVGMVVEQVLPRSPAEGAGLRRGDVVVQVDDLDLTRAGSRDAAAGLERSTATGRVHLAVRRARRSFEVGLTPMQLSRELLAAEPTGRVLEDGTGYLHVPSFTREDTGALVHDLVRRQAEAGGRRMILDLRGNSGGNLGQLGLVLGAFDVTGTWARATSRGTVAWQASYAVEAGEGVSRLATPDGHLVGQARVRDPVRFTGPLVVLVDEHSSSAGEVGALVLQGNGRARVVGQRTPGNVEAVRGFPLPDGSVVMVAVANLAGADGRSFDGGVQPDVVEHVRLAELARGFDAPVAVARSLLAPLPFVPGRVF